MKYKNRVRGKEMANLKMGTFALFSLPQYRFPVQSLVSWYFSLMQSIRWSTSSCLVHNDVINDKREQYRSGGMLPKTWGVFAFVVTMRGKPFSEEFICKYSSMW